MKNENTMIEREIEREMLRRAESGERMVLRPQSWAWVLMVLLFNIGTLAFLITLMYTDATWTFSISGVIRALAVIPLLNGLIYAGQIYTVYQHRRAGRDVTFGWIPHRHH